MSGQKKEGTYKVTSEDGKVSWYCVQMTRYPKGGWWITNCSSPDEGRVLDKITRRALSDRAWAKLETWV